MLEQAAQATKTQPNIHIFEAIDVLESQHNSLHDMLDALENKLYAVGANEKQPVAKCDGCEERLSILTASMGSAIQQLDRIISRL
jgi:hypothetical protein